MLPDIVIENILAVEANVEDAWFIQDIQLSGVIDVWSSLCGDFLFIQGKARLYGLPGLITLGASFVHRLRGLKLSANIPRRWYDLWRCKRQYKHTKLR